MNWTGGLGEKHARQRARDLLTTGLIVPGCQDCPAVSGVWCDPAHEPPAEMVRVDRRPLHIVHSSRLVAAVRDGHVSKRLLIAQFGGGPLPAGLA